MRTLDAALRDSAESVRDAAERLPQRRWNPPRQRQFVKGVLTGLSAAALVLVVFAIPVWILSEAPQDPPGPPVADAPKQTSAPESIGEPVIDADYRALFPELDFVTGTVRRLASSQVPGVGLLEVYAVSLNGLARGYAADFDEPMTCITTTHGLVCGPDLDPTGLRIIGGSSCPPSQVSVLGLDESATLTLEFTDGSRVEIHPTHGAATWGWNDDEIGLARLTLTGADEETLEEFGQLRDESYPVLPTQPCDR